MLTSKCTCFKARSASEVPWYQVNAKDIGKFVNLKIETCEFYYLSRILKAVFFLGLDICWIWASFYSASNSCSKSATKLCHGKGSLEVRFNRGLRGPVLCFWKLVLVGFRVSNFRNWDIKQPHKKVHWRPGFSRLFHFCRGLRPAQYIPAMVWTWPQVVHILGISQKSHF